MRAIRAYPVLSPPTVVSELWQGLSSGSTRRSDVVGYAVVAAISAVAWLAPALAGRLINQVRDLAIMVPNAPTVTASPDPYDNYLLAIASAGRADFLLTGDKRDLLGLERFEGTRIMAVHDFLAMQRRLP